MKAIRVAIYARVSTTDQDCALQLSDLRRYVEIRGWEPGEEFIDAGVSGAKRSRPRLDELLKAVKKGRFDAVLVWRFDRMARSTTHLIEILDTLRAHGCDFCSTQEQIDTSGATGRLMFTIIAAFAEFERMLIKERVNAGIANAKANGVHCGRPRAHQGIPDALIEVEVEKAGSLRRAAPVLGMPFSTLRGRWKEILRARDAEREKEVVCS